MFTKPCYYQINDINSNNNNKIISILRLAEAVLVGARCEVAVPQQAVRRATVRYNGPLDGAKGLWIGVQYDEPRGKNDGS